MSKIENVDEALEYAQKVNKNLSELGVEIDIMRDCRDKFYQEVTSPELRCVMCELTVLETMLSEIMIRLGRLVMDDTHRERFVLEDDGKTYLMDLDPGHGAKIEVVKMNMREYKEYINRRIGREVYSFPESDEGKA